MNKDLNRVNNQIYIQAHIFFFYLWQQQQFVFRFVSKYKYLFCNINLTLTEKVVREIFNDLQTKEENFFLFYWNNGYFFFFIETNFVSCKEKKVFNKISAWNRNSLNTFFFHTERLSKRPIRYFWKSSKKEWKFS